MITTARTKDVDVRLILRRSPVAEVPGAEKTLRECIHRSECWQGWVDGEIACVWGLIPPTLLSNRAYLWLLTTNVAAERRFVFIRHSQIVIREMLQTYPILYGDVILPNPSAVRWLTWLGAEFKPEEGGKLAFEIRKRD